MEELGMLLVLALDEQAVDSDLLNAGPCFLLCRF
jgi:hypothetical protein